MVDKLYEITWKVAIVADSPEAAVIEAVKVQQDRGSWCNNFAVRQIDPVGIKPFLEKDYREVLIKARLIQD